MEETLKVEMKLSKPQICSLGIGSEGELQKAISEYYERLDTKVKLSFAPVENLIDKCFN